MDKVKIDFSSLNIVPFVIFSSLILIIMLSIVSPSNRIYKFSCIRRTGIVLIAMMAINQIGLSQQYIKVIVDQPEPLTVNAGEDTEVVSGQLVTLGGQPTASGGSGAYSYFWEPDTFLGDVTSSNPVASPEDSVTYILTVVDANNCILIDTVSISFIRILSVQNLEQDLNIMAYPNPNSGFFKIEINPSPDDLKSILVFDLNGQIVSYKMQKSESKIELDLGKVPSGNYVLVIEGKGFVARKIISIIH